MKRILLTMMVVLSLVANLGIAVFAEETESIGDVFTTENVCPKDSVSVVGCDDSDIVYLEDIPVINEQDLEWEVPVTEISEEQSYFSSGDNAREAIPVVDEGHYSYVWTADNHNKNCFNRVDMQKRGNLEFSIGKLPFNYSFAYYDIQVYDASLNLIFSTNTGHQSSSGMESDYLDIGLLPGTYYVNFKPSYIPFNTNLTVYYGVYITYEEDVEIEPNSTSALATYLPNATYLTSVLDYDDDDYFFFEAEQGKVYFIEVGNLRSIESYGIELFNPVGKKSYIYDEFKYVSERGNSYMAFEALYSGYYYICVSGNYGSPVFYNIAVIDPDKNEYEGYIRKFCARLYTVALGRDYDAKGLAEWTDKLASGKQTGAEVARGFFFSTEFKNKNLSDSDYVDTLYRTMFNREPDESGKATWMKALNEGMSREFVYRGFAEGAEFRNLCDAYHIKQGKVVLTQNRDKNQLLTAFVARNYTKALGRAPEEAGINDWTGRILSGKATPADVTAGFIFSAEFTNKNLSNEDFLRVVYQTYFDREPDEVGYNNWLSQLNSGTSRKFVVNNGFSNSLEFRNLVASFGL